MAIAIVCSDCLINGLPINCVVTLCVLNVAATSPGRLPRCFNGHCRYRCRHGPCLFFKPIAVFATMTISFTCLYPLVICTCSLRPRPSSSPSSLGSSASLSSSSSSSIFVSLICISNFEVHSQEELGSWAPTVRGTRPGHLELKARITACRISMGFRCLDEVFPDVTGLCHGAMHLQIILVVFNLLVGAISLAFWFWWCLGSGQ